MRVALTVDGGPIDVDDTGGSLLEALRDLGITSVKDGCSPQGQCGCCTVLVDGRPRVACVTPLRRVAGRSITTVAALPDGRRDALVSAFVAHGASQCGFCTPGILCRLAALDRGAGAAEVEDALLAHLCRCTGWRTIVDAAVAALADAGDPGRPEGAGTAPEAARPAAEAQAEIEGGVSQRVGAPVVLGQGGFTADTAPAGAQVAVPDGAGGWAVGPTLAAARRSAAKVQGRRSGSRLRPPVQVPPGDWDLTLATNWVEPGYLEPDASWCVPGGRPTSPLANGGAFGAKADSPVCSAAHDLAERLGTPVLAVFSREDAVRLGPKRPPIAAGLRADGTGIVRVVRTAGIAAAIASVAPGLLVEEVDVPGPPTSVRLRAAGWAEAAVLTAGMASLLRASGGQGRQPPGTGSASVTAPGSPHLAGTAPEAQPGTAHATVTLGPDGHPSLATLVVHPGRVLDEVVLRSYITGAAHMALGWVLSEGIAVDDDGVPVDLTIRSWGILRARHTPPVAVAIAPSAGGGVDDIPPVPVGDAAFAAVAAATWIAQGLPPSWPTSRGAAR